MFPLAALVTVALAQDASPSPVPDPRLAPSAPAVHPAPLAGRSAWVGPELPPDAGPLSSFSVGADGVWAAGDVYGGVYLSADRGLHWWVGLAARVSPHVDDDEALLLEAEATVEEESDADEDVEVDVTDPTDVEAEVEVDVGDVDELSQNSIDIAMAQAQAEGRRDATVEEAAWVWMHPAVAGLGFSSRSDGLWRTRDSGDSWEHIGDEAGLSEALALGGTVVFGGRNGLVVSADEGDTRLGYDVGDGAAVHQLAMEEGVLYAATDAGLYQTTDGLSWWKTRFEGRALAVAGDPAWAGGVWVAGEVGVLRSDDGGASFRPSGRQPMVGMRGLLGLPEPGHVLAWGDDGVWESADNGVTWAPMARGLKDPLVRGIALVEAWPVIATPAGVWRLHPWIAPTAVAAREQVEVEALIGAALDRQGLDIDLLSYGRTAALAAFVPRLELWGDYKSKVSRSTDFRLAETTADSVPDWRVGVKLCFGGCFTEVSVDVDADYVSEDYLEALDLDVSVEDGPALGVVGGEVVSDQEPVLAAMKTAAEIQRYRVSLAETVSDAWVTHRTLLAQRDALASQSIAAQVQHELQIAEVEARLDLYTGGAYSSLVSESP